MTVLAPSFDIELTENRFSEFFRDVHGKDPFPWQVRLTRSVIENRSWPEVIDLPTGTGKTAVLDTAVYCLAAQPNTTPRRTVFVIDRRIVVDQVHERARRIRDRINAAETPTLRAVKSRLNELSEGEPLGVAALRGGIPMGSEWTHRPEQPWVLVSTVDQFGSRLLFRGYGVSDKMLPVHAALAGNDCLVILDEVHLSRPFAETLHHLSGPSFSRLPRRFSVVEMSATPSNQSAERFTLQKDLDLDQCEELRRRVLAKKRAQVKSIENRAAIPSAVLKIIRTVSKSRIRQGIGIHTMGVIVNRVRTAREVFRMLHDAGFKAHLLTGRMRPLDKATVLQGFKESIDPDTPTLGDELVVVVSTQSIEVGADFSFDSMITECAPIDSLQQRFGRLDRRGSYSLRTGSPAEAWILGAKSETAPKKPDPIYGVATRNTWNELNSRLEDGYIEVGSTSLRDFPDNTLAPKLQAPLLLRSHMEAWVQTSPRPLIQPMVDWHLHGINQRRVPEVSVLWRWDLTDHALRLVPPRQSESVHVSVEAVQKWLSEDVEADISDLPFHAAPEDGNKDRSGAKHHADKWIRWLGFEDGVHPPESAQDIRPGDIIVVDPTRGGLEAGTWAPLSTMPVEDLGDEAQLANQRRVTLRLDPRLPYIVDPPMTHEEMDSDASVMERIESWIRDRDESRDPLWLKDIFRRLSLDFEVSSIELNEEASASGYYVIAEKHNKSKKPLANAGDMDGSDQAGSFTGSGISLSEHLEGVGRRAADVATRLGLAREFVQDLQLAGQLHDLGKVDSRFQLQLVGGDLVKLEMRRDRPLAKSLPEVPRVNRYPRGMRHEIASVAMINSDITVLNEANDPDLVLHLIATHHGYSRPLPPVLLDSEPQILTHKVRDHELQASSNLVESTIALDMADRFWKLIDRYGIYGLAWLEAILRLADHRQSEEESAQL